MNFLNYPSPSPLSQSHPATPFLHQNIFSYSQNFLKVPPFPTLPMMLPLNIKRPNAHIVEETSSINAAPTKKIKIDSLNILLKPNFAESDPYQTDIASRENFSFKESSCSAVSYMKLNDQLLTENRITIHLSTKTAKEPYVKAIPTIDLSRQVFKDVDLNTTDVEVRSPGASLRNLICQKLEENCQALINQMQGLLAMSQSLKRELPKMSHYLEDTQPGTPNTIMSENWHETKSYMDIQRNQEERGKISEERELKESSPVSGGLKANQRYQVKVKNSATKVIKLNQVFVQSVMLKEKKKESRKMNRLQILRAEKEDLERQWTRPDDINLS